jgi:hypothetical protein
MYGNLRERERRLAAMERKACINCRLASASADAAAAGLPALVGSPKQIVWASGIRERALRLADPEVAAKIAAESSARWWIDNRARLERQQ